MELGIFAKTFAGPLPSVLQAVEQAGLRRIQFNFACAGLPSMPDIVDDAARQAIQAAFRQTPMAVEAVSGTFNMVHPDPAERKRGLQQLRVLAQQTTWLDTKLITLCTGSRNADDMWRAHPNNHLPDAWHDLRQTLDGALVIADEHDLLLGIEPETANVIDSVAKAARLLREVNSPRLRIIFDPANLFEREAPAVIEDRITQGLGTLGEHIVSAHAKDRDAQGRVVAAGRGVLPYAHYLRGLQRIGYQGNLILHGLAPDEVAGSVQFIQQQIDQRNFA